mgnify:CR=1 FL=1
MKTINKLKYALLSVLLLSAGWYLLNIWIVMAGTILPIVTIRRLTLAEVNAPFRAALYLTILSLMIAIHVFCGNREMVLAATIYGICAIVTPWHIYQKGLKQ